MGPAFGQRLCSGGTGLRAGARAAPHARCAVRYQLRPHRHRNAETRRRAGWIVIAAAKEFGAHGVGIDIDPDLVRQARANARQAGVENLVRFEEGDLFQADIHDATVVTIYLMSGVNLRLRPKLLSDLKPGTRVISHSFTMGDWVPEKRQYVDGSFLYRWTVPERK